MTETKTEYLAALSKELGVPPEQVFESLVQSEYAYGVTATLTGIILFWIAVYFARFCGKKYKNQSGGDSWEMGVAVLMIIAIFFLIFTANGAHHILSPESYALEAIYDIVVNGRWEPLD